MSTKLNKYSRIPSNQIVKFIGDSIIVRTILVIVLALFLL